jgi:hypothetical protein
LHSFVRIPDAAFLESMDREVRELEEKLQMSETEHPHSLQNTSSSVNRILIHQPKLSSNSNSSPPTSDYSSIKPKDHTMPQSRPYVASNFESDKSALQKSFNTSKQPSDSTPVYSESISTNLDSLDDQIDSEIPQLYSRSHISSVSAPSPFSRSQGLGTSSKMDEPHSGRGIHEHNPNRFHAVSTLEPLDLFQQLMEAAHANPPPVSADAMDQLHKQLSSIIEFRAQVALTEGIHSEVDELPLLPRDFAKLKAPVACSKGAQDMPDISRIAAQYSRRKFFESIEDGLPLGGAPPKRMTGVRTTQVPLQPSASRHQARARPAKNGQ